MKNNLYNYFRLGLACAVTLTVVNLTPAEDEITIERTASSLGHVKPVPVALSGFDGEVLSVLKFDLYVQGFSFTTPDAAQYVITGTDNGSVTGTVTDTIARQPILSRAYSGASLRRQAHFFANDIVSTINHVPGIGLTKIAFKKEISLGHGEIYVSDFDGHDPQAVTHDDTIVAAPCWVPGRLALYYTSYYPGNPDIIYTSLSSGQRSIVAKYSGLNTAPAASPDGSRLAMVLSRSGKPNIWVANADGSEPKKLTSTDEDSSPCWSPDGQWICFVTKIRSRRVLAKVPAAGGDVEVIHTSGQPNPTEPDWSPDNKWIAFTRQIGGEFDICVVPADGSQSPTVLVLGEDPSWSLNSRTLVFTRRTSGGSYALSVLDVMTKQVKDIKRISGNDSQPAWAR
jgi:TolB protein